MTPRLSAPTSTRERSSYSQAFLSPMGSSSLTECTMMDGCMKYPETIVQPRISNSTGDGFENGTFDEEGIENKNFIIHIGKPIYKKQNLSDKENIEYMKDQNYKSWVNTYEGFYGKKLKFNIKKKVK